MVEIDPADVADPTHTTDKDIEVKKLEIENSKLQIELSKLDIERTKVRWTAISVIVPLVAAMGTIVFGLWNTMSKGN